MKRLLPLLLIPLVSTAYGADIAGQNNSVRSQVDSLVDRVYDVGFAFTSQPYKLADTTSVIQALSWSADAAAKRFYVQRDTTITVAADDEWYDLPSDFWKIPAYLPQFGVLAWGDDDGVNTAVGMKPISVSVIGGHRDDQGIPQYYVVQKFQIHIEPANTSNDTVRVLYAARSNVLSALTDSTNVDWEYIDFIVYDALETIYRGINWGGSQAIADAKLAEFGRIKAEIVADIENRNKSMVELLAQ
ncbi:MAG: phage adaptor protein [Planctomycetota bacterium]|jgi:hypothetical protein